MSVSGDNGRTAFGTLTPLLSLTAAADDDLGLRKSARLSITQPDLPVIEQQLLPGLDRGEDLRVRQRDPALVAGTAVEIEPELPPALELDLHLVETADAQLRPLQVDQTCRSAAASPPRSPRIMPEALGVLLVAAVAEIQAEHIHAGLEQRAELLGRSDCRAERGQDLGCSSATHQAVPAGEGGSEASLALIG